MSCFIYQACQKFKINALLCIFVVWKDRISPTLLSCPGPISAMRTENWGVEVAFDVPVATDNYDSNLVVVTTPKNLSSPFNFTIDTLCIYEFYDDNNNSVSCAFQIYVEGILILTPLFG